PVAPPAPAGTFLRLAFEPGVSRRYRMDMDTLMKTPMFGEEGMTMKMGMDMKQTVGKVKEDGSAQVLSVIESISMEMANPMTGVIKVDTKDEASMKEAESNPMLGQMVGGLKQIVGKSMDMTMKPSGECVEIKGVDELMAGLSGGMGGSGGAQMTGIPSPFPEGSVTEGQEWPFEQSQESPLGTMVTTGKMKVKSLSKDTGIAVLSIDGTVAVKPSEEEADPEDMQAQMMAMIKVKNAKMSGEMTFDSRGGFLRKSTTLMTMDMENPMMGGDMAVEAKVVMSLLE
ncbi:MAG: hypothetical protein HUU06_11475, partial [Planctomycetaceae bacterium]|nr:hypothetical protein [Planctomycetaceae bacterium]